MAYVFVYPIWDIAGVNAQIIHMLNGNMKIRCRIFIGNLITVSKQIKRCSEVSTGVHKPLHPKVHQSETQIEENSNDDIVSLTSRGKKKMCKVLCIQVSCLSKYFHKCCEKYLCLQQSTIVCNDCYKGCAKPTIEDSD
uniref:Uncharacterized protein n=1 Tax=Ixodes ricinus TaxID=34613 RepID=A0A0K8RIP3_IXORI